MTSESSPPSATVLVRGETVRDPAAAPGSAAPAQAPAPAVAPAGTKPQAPEVSDAKVKLKNNLPALADDADVGVEKEQRVIRDGKPDLAFIGTLLASAAPSSAPQGQWQEYRIYATNGGKHVFSKITRNVIADQPEVHEADIFDPAPTSVPSKLLRSARDLTHSHPMTWADAAVAFFGYDPISKALYRKLGGQFEEHIA
jgi:hypothetical protein